MAGRNDHRRDTGFYNGAISVMKNILVLSGVSLTIFLLNLLLVNFSSNLPNFFTSYLNDLLCLPIVLSICFFVIRFFSKNKRVQISLFSAFSLAALYSVYFEIYLPEVTTRYTSDAMDGLLYFTGALIFWLVQKLGISAKKKAT